MKFNSIILKMGVFPQTCPFLFAQSYERLKKNTVSETTWPNGNIIRTRNTRHKSILKIFSSYILKNENR